jgi:hypothetical protein
MRSKTILLAMAAAVAIASIGCRNHESKVADLQKQYDDLELQFRNDCSGELYKVPPNLSPKCSDEDKKTKDAWARLQAERAKK